MLSLSPVAESATLLRRIGVVVGSVLVTLGYCLDVLWRAAARRLDRARVDRYTRGWAAALLRLVRLQVSVFGAPPNFSDGRRYIILCTHASHYDIPVSFVALPGSIRMLAKSELYRIPVLGLTMRLAEFPSINRHKRTQALADLARARQMMESGIVLWAAPEGTRSRTGELLPFKKGCFHLALDTEAVIVPVAIRGIHRVLPARSWRFNLGQQVSVHVGEPIDAATYTREDLPALMAETRQRIAALLGGSAV
ncbi:lysophospholipid acyltransferase family protein [Pseudomonas sp.]|uniref:lysophospholipid acyltransferase family protein n=1 Tax=Pseudomonas sp. TaxID=306 RepID=UPI000C90FB84|nr:1-acyl-sn-glycerol-3-phosphate acyltransferase [Pseudomonadales bacterium]